MTDAERDDAPEPAGPPAEPGLKLRLEEKLGVLDDLKLVGYRGYGTRRSLHVKGRLIEAKGERGTLGDEEGLLHNVLTTLRRMDSDEIPGALLRARYGGREHDLFTDGEGYFQLNLYVDEPLEGGWHEVEVELVDSVKEEARARTAVEALVPSADVEFAVVSDLDDTVIRSSATDKLDQARLTLLGDAGSRSPFRGVAALYRALVRGPDGRGINPIFYLSRSGWNLYDLFVEFLDAHDIPPGPMFLRDLAVREDKSSALGSEHHKLARIRDLLRSYPELPFVLIGDSGQGDAAKYRQLAIENPGRVRAVYIRDVTEGERDRQIRAIAADLRDRGVPTLLGEHSVGFAEHMAEEGLVEPDAVEDVRDETGEPRPSEDVV